MGRVIFHIDLNAFFANAEILLNPALANKPLAVAGSSRRSVVSTCSYEARAYGIHSAMSIQEAKKRCKDLIIVQGNYDYYEELSAKFINYIKQHTDKIEQVSIDECYADMTQAIMRYKYPLDLAWKIQKDLVNNYGLKCSIGVAPNKFLAKMASDMKKPMGITVLRLSEVPTKLWPLDIKEMRGIGKKTLPYVKALGINTIKDLATYEDINQLKMIFGKNTDLMIARAHGKDQEEVVCNAMAKSMGQSVTLLEDISDYQEIKGVFTSLTRSLANRLLSAKVAGNIISITVKYYDFHTIVRSKRIDHYIYKQSDLFENAMDLFDLVAANDTPIRLLGVTIQDIKDLANLNFQLNIFDEHDYQEDIQSVIKNLNQQLEHGGKLILAKDIKKEKRA
ncbi:MAG: DNA polymerase IV [Erysipelotrichaceae bacterium]|nr:DNA polymerase IV [Erysipelotrichaceae bacterium]MDY5251871.1 DNA polymerase IV [Erysipelotrichaceae bacterium]